MATNADLCHYLGRFIFSSMTRSRWLITSRTCQTSRQKHSHIPVIVLIKSRIHIFYVHFREAGEWEGDAYTDRLINCSMKKAAVGVRYGMTDELTILTELRKGESGPLLSSGRFAQRLPWGCIYTHILSNRGLILEVFSNSECSWCDAAYANESQPLQSVSHLNLELWYLHKDQAAR